MISRHRLYDGPQDCLYGDDESDTESCSLNLTKHRFTCKYLNNTICLVHKRLQDRYNDCDDGSDEKNLDLLDSKTTISFQTMCDGVTELSPIVIEGRSETDETECTHFPCNNTYTRCDGFWSCVDGADEINCEWPPICPSLQHMCLLPITNNLTCLPIERVNDNIIDCLGASDEREYCWQSHGYQNSYRCSNSTKCTSGDSLCFGPILRGCPMSELSEDICKAFAARHEFPCAGQKFYSHISQFVCTLGSVKKLTSMHFSLIGNTSYSFGQVIKTSSSSAIPITTTATNEMNKNLLTWKKSMAWYCNRGIVIRRSIKNGNDSDILCLCPPAYYGRLCEYQNQRTSLTVQIKASYEWRTEFAIIITLRDNKQGLTESYDQVNYIPFRDCNKKFSVYLLYATRPKNTSTNYTVRIDIYNKETLEYRASWAFPILFPFLPVQRMSIQLQIPLTMTQKCETLQCGIHGRCLKYVNSNISFCQCDKGWSGIHCNISYSCNNCSSDSLCLDSSICVCPLGKFGHRCYLKQPECSCENNGICRLNDVHLMGNNDFWCDCPEGFSGLRCQKIDTKIIISFEPTVRIQSLVVVHFIQAFNRTIPHIHTTIIKAFPFDKDTITVIQPNPFHIVFVEIERKTFYLLILKVEYQYSTNISSKVFNSNRCLSIHELFNKSFIEMHLLRRIKYYHIPCQERTNLVCFYDENHMCICNKTLRQANCFTFNHSAENYNYQEENICENGGYCFQDKPKCPTTSKCACDECSYGSRCEISTKGFGLSLDIILGYQIRPNETIAQQHPSVKVTIAISTIMLICGLISSIFCIMTFHTNKAREIGCGTYLLTASSISICIFITFALKIFFLIRSHMGLITNRNYILFNCRIIDFILKSSLTMIDWLYAYVGFERTIIVIQDVNFNKTKSKRLVKWVIISICLFTMLTYLHDPIYRRLIDDEDADRIWCIVQYTPFLKIYNSVILLLHFFLPFISNIISALIIIITVARQKSTAQRQTTYGQQLRRQFYELKHLLISPFILIILALPQLIISFLSGCMKSPRNPWLHLFGYLSSFIPPMLLFFIFVLPSDTYKNQFKNAIQCIRKYFSHQQ